MLLIREVSSGIIALLAQLRGCPAFREAPAGVLELLCRAPLIEVNAGEVASHEGDKVRIQRRPTRN